MASLGIKGKLFVHEKLQHEEIQERSQECGTDSQISSYLKDISCLKQKILDMEACHKNEIDILQEEMREFKKNCFSIENAKQNKEMLHFYTGLPDYEAFEILFNYLLSGPAVKTLAHFGPKTGEKRINSETYVTKGIKRSLSPQQELFIILSRLRCGLLEKSWPFVLVSQLLMFIEFVQLGLTFCILDCEPFKYGHQDKQWMRLCPNVLKKATQIQA